MILHCSFLNNRPSPPRAAHLEKPVLSSQCSADPDIFSILSASRNTTRHRDCIYFCIWYIMVSFHISSVWALRCLKKHLPFQSSSSRASSKTQQLPWAVIMLLHGGLTCGFLAGFSNFILKYALEFAWLSHLEKERGNFYLPDAEKLIGSCLWWAWT